MFAAGELVVPLWDGDLTRMAFHPGSLVSRKTEIEHTQPCRPSLRERADGLDDPTQEGEVPAITAGDDTEIRCHRANSVDGCPIDRNCPRGKLQHRYLITPERFS
jgi:hypothetical protein